MLPALTESLSYCYAFLIFVFDFDLCDLALLMPIAQIKINSRSYPHLMMNCYLRSYFPIMISNLDALTAAIKLKSDPKSRVKLKINPFITIKKSLQICCLI